MNRFWGIIAVACLVLASAALAAEPSPCPPPEQAVEAPAGLEYVGPDLELSGWAKLSLAADWAHEDPPSGMEEYNGLSRLRIQSQPRLDADFENGWKARLGARLWHDFAYALHGRDEFSGEALDSMENNGEVWEAWVQGTVLNRVDVKAGRQIVVWGTSDDLRVTDVINPLDLREPGMTDIEDLRLPVAMTRLDCGSGPWNVTGLLIHETRRDMIPVEGSPYDSLPEPLPHENAPPVTLENTQFGLALTGRFSGFDASLHYADLYEHTPHLEKVAPAAFGVILVPNPPPFPPTPVPVMTAAPVFERRYARIRMLGAAGDYAYDNWLIKAEAAYLTGIRIFRVPETLEELAALPPDSTQERLDTLLGFDYNGFTDTTLSVEAVVRHLFHHEDWMEGGPGGGLENEVEYAVRGQRDFAQDTWHLLVVGTFLGDTGDDGWAARTQVEYDYTDEVTLTLGGVHYATGDQEVFQTLDENDRVFGEVKYGF